MHSVEMPRPAAVSQPSCFSAAESRGKDDLHQMLTTLHVANKAMEDIRQPLDNPYLDEDEKKLALEVKRYREIAADRKARDAETQASKRRIHVQLRLLSGEYRHGISTLVPTSYEELQQAFLEAFPWHLGEVAAERPDGSALHPQRCGVFEPGQVACFREVATPTEDLLTHRLQEAPAGWARETYRPGLLALSTTLAAGGACEKPNHTHTHHLHIPRHHQHHHHGDGQSSRHSSSHHKSHHSSHGSGSHAGN